MDRITQLEEETAHLTKTVEELSDIVARQEREITLLTNRVRMLMEREAERELDAGGTAPLARVYAQHRN
ncbi:MAG: SlyX family protein, partial [Litoreibacter sp.]|nr:SlyX family protein [Litoreibacter sp.]